MNLEEIKKAIEQLPKDQRSALIRWLADWQGERSYASAIYAFEDDLKALDERLKKLEHPHG